MAVHDPGEIKADAALDGGFAAYRRLAAEGRLGIRLSGVGERLGRDAGGPALVSGRLVVADERSPLAVLFGDVAPAHGVGSGTTRMMLFTVQVQGVPEIHVEEAVHLCVEVLTEEE